MRWIADGRLSRGEQWGVVIDPDELAASEFEEPSPIAAREILAEAVEHLQGRQAAVYDLTMRCGLSLSQAAEQLGLSKDTVRTYHDRAIKFVTAYCKEAIEQGRV